MMTLTEQTLKLQKKIELLESERDARLYKLRQRALAHAKAMDPDGKAYLRYRVPESDLSIEVNADTVTLKGVRRYSGDCDSETWTMPLDYVNSDTEPTAWFEELSAHARKEQEAKEAAAKKNEERRERAQLKRLQEKYNGSQ